MAALTTLLSEDVGLKGFWENRQKWPAGECVAVIPAGTVIMSRVDGCYHRLGIDQQAVLKPEAEGGVRGQRIGTILGREAAAANLGEFWIAVPWAGGVPGQTIPEHAA